MDNFDPINLYLEKMPLAPLPDGFVQKTMQRVILKTHFRLRFLDLALPAFVLFFLPVVFGIVWWVFGQIDPLWLAQTRLELEFQWLILPQTFKTLTLMLVPAAVFASFAALSAGGIALLAYRSNQQNGHT